jgi:hypothetical protein
MADAPLPAPTSTCGLNLPRPDWCNPADCRISMGGAHRSQSREVPVVGGRLSARLVQRPGGLVQVLLVVDAVAARMSVKVAPAEARDFGRGALVEFADWAEVVEAADCADGKPQNRGRWP